MFRRKKRQQGSMIVIAIFIIIVLSMLAVNLTRLGLSNQDTLVRENQGAQAWFLSVSASEWALASMYPLDTPAGATQLATRCSAINNGNTAIQNALTQLAGDLSCDPPVISCNNPNASLPVELQYFQITASATCGSNGFQVQRGQEVWAKPIN